VARRRHDHHLAPRLPHRLRPPDGPLPPLKPTCQNPCLL
jgi:hypothetical protein